MQVDIVISGIGAVWAASATTAALLSGGKADAIISCGCSGAHVVGQKMGDMVLGAQVKPLDARVIAADGTLTYSGVRFSMTTKGTTSWEADPTLLALATTAAHEVRATHAPEMRIDVGVVGSGDAWRQSVRVIHEVHEQADTLCEEMEAHAVAQVASHFKVPFVAIKDVANSELAPEDIQLEPSHHIVPESCKVGYHAALVTESVVRMLAGVPTRTEPLTTPASATSSAASSPTASRKRASSAAASGSPRVARRTATTKA